MPVFAAGAMAGALVPVFAAGAMAFWVVGLVPVFAEDGAMQGQGCRIHNCLYIFSSFFFFLFSFFLFQYFLFFFFFCGSVLGGGLGAGVCGGWSHGRLSYAQRFYLLPRRCRLRVEVGL